MIHSESRRGSISSGKQIPRDRRRAQRLVAIEQEKVEREKQRHCSFPTVHIITCEILVIEAD